LLLSFGGGSSDPLQLPFPYDNGTIHGRSEDAALRTATSPAAAVPLFVIAAVPPPDAGPFLPKANRLTRSEVVRTREAMFMRLHVAVFALLLSPAFAYAQAHSVATSDDLSMGVSADGGVTSVRIGDADLPLRGAGRFSLADYQRQPEPVNLITNPGFEQGTADWGLLPSQHLDREVAHSGAASMRIEIPGPEAGKSSLGTTVSV